MFPLQDSTVLPPTNRNLEITSRNLVAQHLVTLRSGASARGPRMSTAGSWQKLLRDLCVKSLLLVFSLRLHQKQRRVIMELRRLSMETPVILSAVRTPVGKFQGGLSSFSAPELGGKVIAEAARRAGLDAKQIDEAILGNVVQAGLGQNPARQAALKGGCDPRVAAMTINKVCGSGLKAVALAAQAVTLDESEIVVAGGMESMTNCPYLLPQARSGYRIGNGVVVDSMVHDGLWDTYEDFHMGMTGELVAEKYGITREEQDKFAFESHQKAVL